MLAMPRARLPHASIETQPLTPDRWDDLVQLFGPGGADGGCWCMYWRYTQAEYASSSRALNKVALRESVDQGRVPGLLAYKDGQPAGWCGVSPRASFARLVRSRNFPSEAPPPVWAIVCFFVAREQRAQGVAAALLTAAVDYAGQHGARSIEGYPVKAGAKALAAQAAFPGTTRMFRAAGFRLVALTGAVSGGLPRAIMRFDIVPT